MRGKYGAPMTVFRVKRRPRPQPQVADNVCPLCFSVRGEPCRRVLSPPGPGTLRLGGIITKLHPERRGAAPRPAPRPAPPPAQPTMAPQRQTTARIDPATGRRVMSASEAVAGRRKYPR